MSGTINHVNGILISKILAAFNAGGKGVNLPSEFEAQCHYLDAFNVDHTGLINSHLSFMIESASVDYRIISENKKYNKILDQWLYEELNKDFNGILPRGINALAEEYFRERWAGASFPILKIMGWKKIDGIELPVKVAFVEGKSVRAQLKDTEKTVLSGNYTYSIGDEVLSDAIFQKCYARWFDKYPKIFLFDRGILANGTLIKILKLKQGDVLDEIIPLINLIKKSTELLLKESSAGNGGKAYDNDELKEIADGIENDVQSKKLDPFVRSLFRVVNADEEWKHIIPDVSPLFKDELTKSAEKAILCGFGLTEVTGLLASNRKESVLSPAAFMREVKDGVKDFREKFLAELYYRVKEKNKGIHPKYVNATATVTSSPVKDFLTEGFKNRLSRLWDKGLISGTTILDICGETSIELQSDLRKCEDEDKMTDTLKPRPAMYQDLTGDVAPGNKNVDKNGDDIDPSKQGPDTVAYKNAEAE